MSDINTTLKERGNRYGAFESNAQTTQRIKATMQETYNWAAMPDDCKEALEMIAHKMSRIIHGDPNYDDSWVDISGYATLVAKRIRGE